MNHQLYDSSKLIPLADRDRELEELWAELEDIPFDEDEDGRLILAEPWMHFEKGAWNEDIWRWFDERYTKGVYHLIYGYGGVDRTDEIARLVHLNGLCFECETKDCAYNECRECRFALVKGKKPTITDEEGCTDGVINAWR